MPRRSAEDATSLDLLLDTITNTLGGILFLAILLVLLTKASKAIVKEDRHAPEFESQQILEAIAAAESELRRAEAEDALAHDLAQALSDPEAQESIERALALRNSVDALRSERDGLLAESEAKKRAIEESEAKRESLAGNLAEQLERLVQAEAELSDERESRTEDLPLPRESAARKESFSVIVRYGRLYFTRRSHPNDSDEANLDDFFDLGTERTAADFRKRRVITPKPWRGVKRRVITPKPWRGDPILLEGKLSLAVQRALKAWSPNRYYATVSVWDDSFAEMRAIRAFFVENKYKYRLLPLTDGGSVYEGAVTNARTQ